MRRALFALAAVGGFLAMLVDRRPAGDGRLKPAATLSAPELAQWIHDRKPGLRILDGRAQAAYDWYHIPGAEHASTASGSIVVMAESNTYVLRGGMQAWLDMLKSPTAIARYFGGPPRRGGC